MMTGIRHTWCQIIRVADQLQFVLCISCAAKLDIRLENAHNWENPTSLRNLFFYL